MHEVATTEPVKQARASEWEHSVNSALIATSHQDTADKIQERVKLPASQYEPPGIREPKNPTSAALWKIEQTVKDIKEKNLDPEIQGEPLQENQAIVATDVVSYIGSADESYGKLERYEEEITNDLRQKYPDFTFEYNAEDVIDTDGRTYEKGKFTRECRKKIAEWLSEHWYKENKAGGWIVAFGVRMPDGERRIARAIIESDIPKLGADVIDWYLSDDVSGGIGLLQFFRDLERDPDFDAPPSKGIYSPPKEKLEEWRQQYRQPFYAVKDFNDEPVGLIRGEMAEDLIRKKIPPSAKHLRRLMGRVVVGARHTIETLDDPDFEGQLFLYALLSVHPIELLDQGNELELRMRDGTKGKMSWINEQTAPKISELMKAHFQAQGTYAQIKDSGEFGITQLENANSVGTQLEEDAKDNNVLAMLAIHDDEGEVVGYLRMVSAYGSDGEEAASIKRIYVMPGQTKYTMDDLVGLAGEIARAFNIRRLLRMDSVTAADMEELQQYGFEPIGPWNKSMFTGEQFQSLEKLVIPLVPDEQLPAPTGR